MADLTPFEVDRDDPRAPPMEVWERLSPEERRRVVDMLPADVPFDLYPPEGDLHREGKEGPLDALRRFYRAIKRRIYLTAELTTYYPGEPRFVPDLLAVLDVDDHPRMKWVVADEGRGLDLVIEVHVSGDRHKDFVLNVEHYARLGIPEYFVFDRQRSLLRGFRLPDATARAYRPIVPQGGKYASAVLGLDLAIERDRLRFYYGPAPVPETEELVAKLDALVGDLVTKHEEAARLVEQERARADAERARVEQERDRAERAERRIAELEAELERLRRERDR